MEKPALRLKLLAKEERAGSVDEARWDVLWLIPLLVAAVVASRFLFYSVSNLVVEGIGSVM